MSMCNRCNKLIATQKDYDTIPDGEGEHLCWSVYGSPCAPYDWRGECLALRAEVAMLRAAKAEAEHAHNELLLSLQARLRDAAERQREACAKACERLAMDESRYAPTLADDCASAVSQSPLVTGGES